MLIFRGASAFRFSFKTPLNMRRLSGFPFPRLMKMDDDTPDLQSTPQWLRSARRLFGQRYPEESPAEADSRAPPACYDVVSSGEEA